MMSNKITPHSGQPDKTGHTTLPEVLRVRVAFAGFSSVSAQHTEAEV